MELQFEKKVCRYLNRAVREVQEQEQTQEIRLTEGMPDVGRVISAWGQVILRGKEWRGDCVVLSGGVMAWVMYAPEDGGEERSLDAWIPFKMKWDLPEGLPEGDIRARCLLRSLDARSVSPRKIILRAGMAAQMEAYAPAEADVYTVSEPPERVELLKRTYPVRLPREAGEKTFLLDDELTLPESCPRAQRLVYASVQPGITERKVLADKVVFRGGGNLHVLCRSQEGELFGWDFELPFSQFAQLQDDYSPEAWADVAVSVTSLETDLNAEGNIRVKCGLVGQYLVSDRELLELAEDAYSPGRELRLNMQEPELPAMLECRMETVSAEHKIQMDAVTVVDSAFLPDFPRKRRTDTGVALELPGVFQVLCRGENGELKSGTARWEGTVSLKADENSCVEGDILHQARPRAMIGEGGVNLSAETPLQITTESRCGIPMVAGVTIGEDRLPDPAKPSLILRRAGGDDLWKLAKRCGSTMAAIQRSNDLQGEPAENQILLIPVV